MELTEREKLATEQLCLALNVRDPFKAESLANDLVDFFGYFKLTSVLISSGVFGLPLIERLNALKPGKDGAIFLDLKWHDTPDQVYEYAYNASRYRGVSMFTVHVCGGEKMCKRAVEGAEDATMRLIREEGFSYMKKRPKVIGVTELTTTNLENFEDSVMRKAEEAKRWGLEGITAPGTMAGRLQREFGSDFLYVFPGMEWKGIKSKSQIHTYSPEKILKECENFLLVAGSAVIRSEDKVKTAYEIIKAIAT